MRRTDVTAHDPEGDASLTQIIHRAMNLNDLRVPPGNRLEVLSGDLAGFHSIRINEQWRVVFRWVAGDAFDVSIVDYHQEDRMAAVNVPIHPGEILSEELIKPAGITQGQLAQALGVSRRTVNEVMRGRRSISAEMAVRLSKVLGTSAEMWLGLQADYDLLTAPKIVGLKRIRLSA